MFFLLTFPSLLSRELTYPTGVKPGDQVSGTAGEFFRYRHVFVSPPTDEDRFDSLKMSNEIKCDVCKVLLDTFMKKAESWSEDHLLDQMEGALVEEERVESEDPQAERVAKNKKGCNKHFKDELMKEGWKVARCERMEVDEETKEEWKEKGRSYCLEKGEPMSQTTMDTYSSDKEALFYACEGIVGSHGDEIAEFVSEKMEEGEERGEVVREACYEVAKCDRQGKKKRGKGKKGKEEL